MKNSFHCFLLCLFFLEFSSTQSLAQHIKTDSLLKVLQTEKEDTNKVNTLTELSKEYTNAGNYEQVLFHSESALKLAKELNFKKGIAESYSALAVVYHDQGKNEIALEYYTKSIKLFEEIGDRFGVCKNYTHLGSFYSDQGQYEKTIEFHLKALKIREEIRLQQPDNKSNLEGISHSLCNIGNVKYYQKRYKEANDNYLKALDVLKLTGNKKEIASLYNNIGLIYKVQGDIDKSIEFRLKALKSFEELGFKEGIAYVYTGLGSIYSDKKEYKLAETYLLKTLAIYQEMGFQTQIAQAYLNLAGTRDLQKKHNEVDTYLNQAFDIIIKTNNKELLKEYYALYSTHFAKLNNYQKAYEYHQLYSNMKDTLLNEENNKQILEMQTKYDTEKKDKDLIKKDAEIKMQEAVSKQKSIERNGFIIGFALMILLAIFIFKGYRQKQKANIIITEQKKEVEKAKNAIEQQKELVEEKNKEVLDSIYYARRIQRALLTSEVYIKKHLNADFFILFKPKDIVSGDFYWAAEHNNLFFIMTADCTGHGVPGAFMSMLGINYLNEIIMERNIKNPALILDILREEIIRNLNPEDAEEEAKDGMDAVLCVYDMQNKILDFAAANNPLWLNRNGKITEYKADKMPVGKYLENALGFTRQRIELEAGDTIYTFTDGYADQFGGEKGKKFKYKQLQDVLLSNSNKSMKEQKNILDKTFDDWRTELEQVDDVLVIGISI